MTTYNILMELNESNSSLHKKEVLRKHKDNELFKRVCRLTYNKQIQFYVKKIPTYSPQGLCTLESVLDRLDLLSRRGVTGKDAITYLGDCLTDLTFEDAQVLERIIKRDLKTKTTATLINECMGPVVPTFPYMGALSYSQKKVKELFENNEVIYSDEKMDGRYLDARVDLTYNNIQKVTLLARGGNETFVYNDKLCLEISRITSQFSNEIVLNGELLIKGVSRYESNGIIASLVSIGKKEDEKTLKNEKHKFEKEHTMSYDEALNKVHYIVWDYVDKTCYDEDEEFHMTRTKRLTNLKQVVETLNLERISFCEYEIVNNPKEAMTHFIKLLEQGKEGTILKGGDAIWKSGKHKNQIKFKLEMNVDLEILSGNYGTVGTKNENVISSLNCRTSDGMLISSPGGMSESLMNHVTENLESLIGFIVEVKCSGVSTNKNNGMYSLLHPSVVKLRDDKSEANSLDEALEIEESAKELI